MGGRFTDKAEEALNLSMELAEEMGHTYIGSEHALLSLLSDKTSCAYLLLKRSGISKEKIEVTVKEISGFSRKSKLNIKDTTPRYRKIIESAYRISQKYSSEKIGTEHLLLAILDEKNSTAEKVMERAGFDTVTVKDEVVTFLRAIEKNCALMRPLGNETNIPTLLKYGRNLTAEAKNSPQDPIIGRERETDRLIRILSRKTKNNPCLVGDAGVGKTAIVEGVAQKIASNDVPDALKGKTLVSIDLSSMIAGAKYRGDFEDRVKNILEEVRRDKTVILFIDEIHTIVGAGSAEGAIDAANILKPALARGELHLIGATTLKEYRKYIESDSALERRFQPLMIEEPSFEKTVEILKGLRPAYEKYHGVSISDDAIVASVILSKRYIRDRFFPDKAIDVLDEACAKASVFKNPENNILQKTDNKQEQTVFCEERPELNTTLTDIINYEPSKYTTPITIDEDSIREIVEEMVGMPIRNDSIFDKMLELESKLKKSVVGQDNAIRAVCDAIIRNTAGINGEDRPRGVFMFVGESGVGKTELAIAIAKELFSDQDALIRYDMSEFSEKHSVSKLIGSPPGYVGYNEHSAMTDMIRSRPYSIILFDEIEKAHPDVINLFLQLTDTGKLTDSTGRSADFRNAYVIMTTNATTDLVKDGSLGFVKNNKNDTLKAELKKHFSAEFINRIDEVVVFDPPNENTLYEITKIKLTELCDRLKKRAFTLMYNDEVIRLISEKAKVEGGARAITHVISREIETPIAKIMISRTGVSLLSAEVVGGKIRISDFCKAKI